MAIFGLSKKSLTGLILVAALSSGNSYAAKIVLDFEGIGDLAAVNDFYNFGVDSAGNTGTDYGITFSNSAFGIIDRDLGFDYSGLFANAPSPHTALIFREGGSATLNVEAGFDSEFSLFYSSSVDATVRIFDGLDGTGHQLAILNLATNFTDNNCSVNASENDVFCHWDQAIVAFKGNAKSVVFDGTREFTFYDNITLGSNGPSDCKKYFKKLRRNYRFNDNDDTFESDDRKECKNYSRWHRKNRHSKWHD